MLHQHGVNLIWYAEKTPRLFVKNMSDIIQIMSDFV